MHARSFCLSLVATSMLLCMMGCRPQQPIVHTGRMITLTDSMFVTGGADTLQFGHMHAGEIARQEMWLRNNSSHILVVTTHETSCGCTMPEYEHQPFAPGNDLKLAITFDSQGLYGWQMKLIEFHFADRAQPLKIYLEAEIE